MKQPCLGTGEDRRLVAARRGRTGTPPLTFEVSRFRLRPLPPEPVAHLHHEDVLRALAEDAGGVAREVEVAEELLAAALLLPHQEERGARAVLPAQHRVAAQ